jgi:hypothetical protein
MELIIIFILLLIILATFILIIFGDRQWQIATQALRQPLVAWDNSLQAMCYDANELKNLPPPVQRYLELVLTPEQPIILRMNASHSGDFSFSENVPKWVPFRSNQLARMHPIGFDWDGRIRMGLGIQCFVHDAYIGGEGLLQATLLGLIPLAKLQGTPEIAQGELLRFLAESPWYPTALLPRQGVSWLPIDDRHAQAILTDRGITVEVEFQFGDNDLIEEFYTPNRHRMVNGVLHETPWGGKVWNYEKRAGMLIPIDGEVSWKLPEGTLPYWRGHLNTINYEFVIN